MQTGTLWRRSNIFSRCFFGKRNANAFFDNSRFQSNAPSPEQAVTNLLQEHLQAIVINPFRRFANMWKLAMFRARYDTTFRLDEFESGAKQAFVVVSRKLYAGDFEGLRGLISEEALSRLRPAVEKLDDNKREILNLQYSDIYGHYMLSANFHKTTSGHDFFEVLFAYHCFLGMESFQQQQMGRAESIATLLQHSDRFVLANVRFAKRLTPAVDADWTVIYANYGRMQERWGQFPPPPPK